MKGSTSHVSSSVLFAKGQKHEDPNDNLQGGGVDMAITHAQGANPYQLYINS